MRLLPSTVAARRRIAVGLLVASGVGLSATVAWHTDLPKPPTGDRVCWAMVVRSGWPGDHTIPRDLRRLRTVGLHANIWPSERWPGRSPGRVLIVSTSSDRAAATTARALAARLGFTGNPARLPLPSCRATSRQRASRT